ncbi:chymotrypsin-1-like isoform X2 [Hermetia illucens]|uniref:chymotrypsin-1-like isoform X2 n=1 Tax=Hermetia illucens TaxID=343691 RepID=UPI0018CC0003|nr:chymotrypsin-1-like isoform X2 [Hermetia illucens]
MFLGVMAWRILVISLCLICAEVSADGRDKNTSNAPETTEPYETSFDEQTNPITDDPDSLATTSSNFDYPQLLDNSEARLGQFPYVVAILYSNYGIKCSGALITSFHVLTAARCVVVDETDVNGPQPKFVMAGDIERDETKNGYQELNDISLFIPHPNYVVYHDLQFDIGLLKVQMEFKQNSLLHTINFGGYSPSDLWREHTMTAAGWGQALPNSDCPIRLRYSHVKFLEKENCDFLDADNIFCSTVEYTCPGAVGSPLVIENELHGIFLESRMNKHLRMNVSIFLRVSSQKYWVFQGLAYHKQFTGSFRSLRTLAGRTEFDYLLTSIWTLLFLTQKE